MISWAIKSQFRWILKLCLETKGARFLKITFTKLKVKQASRWTIVTQIQMEYRTRDQVATRTQNAHAQYSLTRRNNAPAEFIGPFSSKIQAFTKPYGAERSPTKLLWLPGYKSRWKAQHFHTYRAQEPLWSGRQCSPGSASTALHGGWILRVPQNLGARCAIFVSRADLRTRSLALQYGRKAKSINIPSPKAFKVTSKQ